MTEFQTTEPPLGRPSSPTPLGFSGEAQSAEDLLVRAGAADQDAFRSLYESFSARVYGLVLRILRDASQAEEVAQEIFFEIWRRAARFDRAKGSATSWIMTLTHARAVDRVRQSQASRDRDHRSSVDNFDRDIDSVSEAVLQREDSGRIRDCLESLTTLQRQSVTLAYFGGHTQREISELIHVAIPTIKTRVRDGLIRLRDCMGVTA